MREFECEVVKTTFRCGHTVILLVVVRFTAISTNTISLVENVLQCLNAQIHTTAWH